MENDVPWVIFDIDGTLANIKHRLHNIKDGKKDWDAFNNAMWCDVLKTDIHALYKMCSDAGYKIMIVTGRKEQYRNDTQAWLWSHGITFEQLYMRPDGDHRSDVDIKQEIFDNHIDGKDVLFAVDDRDRVVEMWRANNITCLQVQKGDY